MVVELRRSQIGIGLRVAELAFEEALAFLQAPEFCRHHAEEVTDLSLIETAAPGTERSVGDRRR